VTVLSVLRYFCDIYKVIGALTLRLLHPDLREI